MPFNFTLSTPVFGVPTMAAPIGGIPWGLPGDAGDWAGPFSVWDNAEGVYQTVWTRAVDPSGQYTSAKRINSKFPKALAQYDLWLRRPAPAPTNVWNTQWTMICRESPGRGWDCPRGFPYPPVQPAASYAPPASGGPSGPAYRQSFGASGQVGQMGAGPPVGQIGQRYFGGPNVLTFPKPAWPGPFGNPPPSQPCPPGMQWVPAGTYYNTTHDSFGFAHTESKYFPGGCCTDGGPVVGVVSPFNPGCVPPINVPPVYNPCQPGWSYNAAAKKCCPPGYHYDPYLEQCVQNGPPK